MLSVPDYNLHEWDHLYQRRFISRRVTLHKFSDVRPKFPETQLPRLSADAWLLFRLPQNLSLVENESISHLFLFPTCVRETKLVVEGDE